MQETQIQALCWEDPLEKKRATYSSCLGNPMDRGAWQTTVCGVAKESDTTEHSLTLCVCVCVCVCGEK